MKDQKDHSSLFQQISDIDPVIHSPARMKIMTYLYSVDSVDYVFLMRLTGFTWGNLATHLNKLEKVNYIEIQKTFSGKKPLSIIRLTDAGRVAFDTYTKHMQQIFSGLPENNTK